MLWGTFSPLMFLLYEQGMQWLAKDSDGNPKPPSLGARLQLETDDGLVALGSEVLSSGDRRQSKVGEGVMEGLSGGEMGGDVGDMGRSRTCTAMMSSRNSAAASSGAADSPPLKRFDATSWATSASAAESIA